MKKLQHAVLIISFIATMAKAISGYYMNTDYVWPLIAGMWILSSYSGFILNNNLEKKLRKYED